MLEAWYRRKEAVWRMVLRGAAEVDLLFVDAVACQRRKKSPLSGDYRTRACNGSFILWRIDRCMRNSRGQSLDVQLVLRVMPRIPRYGNAMSKVLTATPHAAPALLSGYSAGEQNASGNGLCGSCGVCTSGFKCIVPGASELVRVFGSEVVAWAK